MQLEQISKFQKYQNFKDIRISEISKFQKYKQIKDIKY